MKKLILFFIISISFSCLSTLYAAEMKDTVPAVPIKGMVSMLDLGSDKCIPCKMMTPILEDLKDEYEGKVSIVFIDVWKHPEQKVKWSIKMIPTQIFFDKNGKEIYRHTGFMDKKTIVGVLKKLGVN